MATHEAMIASEQAILDRLPHRPPFRFLSSVTSLRPRCDAQGRWRVTGDEPFFAGHFPSHPMIPGVLIAESLAQLSGLIVFSPQVDGDDPSLPKEEDGQDRVRPCPPPPWCISPTAPSNVPSSIIVFPPQVEGAPLGLYSELARDLVPSNVPSSIPAEPDRLPAAHLAHVDLRLRSAVSPPAELTLHSRLTRTFGTLWQFEVQALVAERDVARGLLVLARTAESSGAS